MFFLKPLLSLSTFYYFLNLINAYAYNDTIAWCNEGDFPMFEILKSGNEVIKLRLEIMDLNMAKQNHSLVTIDQKWDAVNRELKSLENKFEKVLEKLEELSATERVISDTKSSSEFNETTELIDVKSQPKLNGTEHLFVSDISQTDEPQICKLDANEKRICSDLPLSKMCSDSNINCLNNKCRVKNSIYGSKSFWVSCDGEWTVIQRRINGSENFYRNWTDYQKGFGNLDGEFWIGLDKLHSLTTIMGPVQLLIKLQDFNNIERYAKYDSFSVGNEATKYILDGPGSYSGNAGNSLHLHRSEKFSTYDQDNDKNSGENCAEVRQGGWWHYECSSSEDFSNLNGVYYKLGVIPDYKVGSGICWKRIGGDKMSMKSVQMMISPKKN